MDVHPPKNGIHEYWNGLIHSHMWSYPYDTRLSDHMGGFATTSTLVEAKKPCWWNRAKHPPLHDSIVLVVPDEKDVCRMPIWIQIGSSSSNQRETRPKIAKLKKSWACRACPVLPSCPCRNLSGVIGVIVVPQPWSTTLRLDSCLLGIQDCLRHAFFWRVLQWADPWTDPPWTNVILVKEKTNQPQFHHFYRLYKQFPNGWFIVVFPTI